MSILKATVLATSKSEVYRMAAGVAVGCAVTAYALVVLLSPGLGIVVPYVVVPLLAALVAGAIAFVARLRVVGLVRRKSDYLIPPALEPWLRFWLITRFGLLGSWFLLVMAIVATAVLGQNVHYCVEALVYLAMARMLIDLIFGAIGNVVIIARRNHAA